MSYSMKEGKGDLSRVHVPSKPDSQDTDVYTEVQSGWIEKSAETIEGWKFEITVK